MKEEIEDFLKKGREGKDKIPGKHGAKSRNYAYLPIVIDDKPGQLAIIFNECAKIAVNIEDLSIEHSPGQETGLITLALSESDCIKLSEHLEKLGFKVHPTKNR
jgi:prephenate dehydrogenase